MKLMNLNNKKGFAFYMLMGFFVVATMGTTAITRLGGAQTLQSQNNLRTKQAFYLAEAGVETAKNLLDNDFTLPVTGEY